MGNAVTALKPAVDRSIRTENEVFIKLYETGKCEACDNGEDDFLEK
jgi:hypothetical protein